ncbi:MAG: hypothetical protein EOO65_05110 [Methanosarcinales archaeon]|nr:MAG: hypothetical protein EOO65_05110 [Methanosarcinales archaeon]
MRAPRLDAGQVIIVRTGAAHSVLVHGSDLSITWGLLCDVGVHQLPAQFINSSAVMCMLPQLHNGTHTLRLLWNGRDPAEGEATILAADLYSSAPSAATEWQHEHVTTSGGQLDLRVHIPWPCTQPAGGATSTPDGGATCAPSCWLQESASSAWRPLGAGQLVEASRVMCTLPAQRTAAMDVRVGVRWFETAADRGATILPQDAHTVVAPLWVHILPPPTILSWTPVVAGTERGTSLQLRGFNFLPTAGC